MDEKYDLIVIGAGPAGLMASTVAAQEGLKVLLVERKKDVGRVLSKYAEKIKENMQELVNQLKREISNFLVK